MLIKKLILHNYKRFALKNIKHYEFQPESNISIFTWNNGVGKSSLLSQLTPLPPDLKKDFLEGGYKVIELTHKGKEYILTSKDGKHSLKEDNIELNQGGTRRVQLELVESIFKVNPQMINVIHGNLPFTLMSPSERKKWLTEISTIDYSYSISVYQKLLERRRDLSAWVKLTKEKLLEINNYLKSIEDYDKIVKESDLFKRWIEQLLKEYIPLNKQEDIQQLLSDLKNQVSLFKTLEYLLEIDINKTLEELEINNRIFKEQQILLEDLNKKMKDLYNGVDKEKVNTLKEELQEVKKHLESKPSLWNLNNLPDIFNHLQTRLTLIENIKDELLHLPSIKEINFNQLDLEINNLKHTLIKLETAIENQTTNQQQYDSIKDMNKLTCQSCGSLFDIESILVKVKDNLTSLQSKHKEYKERYNLLLKQKEDYSRVKYLEEKIVNLIQTDEYIKTSFILRGSQIHTSEYNLDYILKTIQVLSDTLSLIKETFIPYLQKEEEINKQLLPLLEINIMSRDEKVQTLKILEERHKSILIKIEHLTDKIKYGNNIKESFEKLSLTREKIKELLSKINNIRKTYKTQIENEYIERVISKLKEKNIENNKIIETYNSYQKQLQILNKELNQYEEDIIHVNRLLDVLSPSTGLIAKSINSFLGVFMNEVNSIINTVWSYKMKILPCDLLEGDDLDYKFRVEVNDEFIVEDVSKLSSSMREIVDLAFRLIFIKYKKLDQCPIILDEFGRTMDREHRINAFNLIDQIICSSFDQIFLVCHFEEMYGRFKNAHFPTIE